MLGRSKSRETLITQLGLICSYTVRISIIEVSPVAPIRFSASGVFVANIIAFELLAASVGLS
jgi:hypothetical protein